MQETFVDLVLGFLPFEHAMVELFIYIYTYICTKTYKYTHPYINAYIPEQIIFAPSDDRALQGGAVHAL